MLYSDNTLIRSLRCRSGGERSDPELAVWRSDGEHSDPELAVEVRHGTLFDPAVQVRRGNTAISRACSWGVAEITLILSLLFRSGGEHCDILALAVEVWRRRRRRRRRGSWHKISQPSPNTWGRHLRDFCLFSVFFYVSVIAPLLHQFWVTCCQLHPIYKRAAESPDHLQPGDLS